MVSGEELCCAGVRWLGRHTADCEQPRTIVRSARPTVEELRAAGNAIVMPDGSFYTLGGSDRPVHFAANGEWIDD